MSVDNSPGQRYVINSADCHAGADAETDDLSWTRQVLAEYSVR